MFSKLERKTVRHMMESVGLIALGYIIAVAGAESTAVIIAGLLVMLAGWFFLIRSGHGTLHPKARQVAATRQVEEQKLWQALRIDKNLSIQP